MKIHSYLKIKNMNTKEISEDWNAQRGTFNQNLTVLNGNDLILEEGSKYEMFRKLRNKLGKTKEEFHKIFELYNHLRNL
jgi:predicted transcriptional regulator